LSLREIKEAMHSLDHENDSMDIIFAWLSFCMKADSGSICHPCAAMVLSSASIIFRLLQGCSIQNGAHFS
jgi:hypothetical protein